MFRTGNFSLTSTIFLMEEEPTREQICWMYMSKLNQVVLMTSTKPQTTSIQKQQWLEMKGKEIKALSIPSLPDLGCCLITEAAWFPWLDWAGVVTPGRGPLI